MQKPSRARGTPCAPTERRMSHPRPLPTHTEATLVVPTFQLLRPLGRGGMGDVWLAQRLGPDGFSKRVAVKLLSARYQNDQARLTMFLDEARLHARLDHPNVAQLHELGHYNGVYYLVLEHIDGCDLGGLLKRLRSAGRSLPLELGLHIMSGVLMALAHAHAARDDAGRMLGLVHRDVCPKNILLARDSGAVKLCDFGVARADLIRSTRTEPGLVKGKLRRMAPEQLAGLQVDARADIYSAGILLYELMTGSGPFDGAGSDSMLKSRRRSDPELDPVRAVSYELAAIVRRALEPPRERRFPDAQAMLEALAPQLPDPVRAASRLGYLVRELSPPSTAADEPAEAVSGCRLVQVPIALRRRPLRIWPLALGAALVATLAALWASSAQSSPPRRPSPADAGAARRDLSPPAPAAPDPPAAPPTSAPDPPPPAPQSSAAAMPPAPADANPPGEPPAPAPASRPADANPPARHARRTATRERSRAPRPAASTAPPESLLVADRAVIMVRANQPAEVWIDGVRVGNAPVIQRVAPGRHSLRVSCRFPQGLYHGPVRVLDVPAGAEATVEHDCRLVRPAARANPTKRTRPRSAGAARSGLPRRPPPPAGATLQPPLAPLSKQAFAPRPAAFRQRRPVAQVEAQRSTQVPGSPACSRAHSPVTHSRSAAQRVPRAPGVGAS